VTVLGPGGVPLAAARALVGADGWFSGVRQQMLADGPPMFKDVVVWRARLPRRDDWLASPARTTWWVPPSGQQHPGALLAVLIPVPGGDMVWQAHAPLSLLRERGVDFNPAVGEGASSHAEAAEARAARGGRGQSEKERCLRAFEGFKGLEQFLSIVQATPDAQITEHGLYQRTAEQIPEGAWGKGPVTLVGDAAHTACERGPGRAGAGQGPGAPRRAGPAPCCGTSGAALPERRPHTPHPAHLRPLPPKTSTAPASR
jgi:2-polyprenyl-6-methoxyphenol hydroxylase-like FAD-dependent oxidoreductase